MRLFFSLVLLGTFLCFTAACGGDDDEQMADLDRDQFVGSYTSTETCGNGATFTLSVTIVEGVGDNGIVIRGLYQSGTSLIANVSGNSFSFGAQETNFVNFIEGSGTISNGVITADFDIAGLFGIVNSCSATLR